MTTTFEMQEVEVQKDGETVKETRPVNLKTKKVYESKNQASSVIFREITADESIEKPRAEFLRRTAAELFMSKSCASTYFHNKQRAARGEDEFGFNKATNKKAAEKKRAEKEAKTIEGECEVITDQKVIESDKEALRWQVALKDTRVLVESFASRPQAQTFNKEQKTAGKKTVVIDRNKEVAKVA